MEMNTTEYNSTAAPGHRRRKWLVPIVFAVMIVILGISVYFAWGSIAKYLVVDSHDALLNAKEFYFTSDYLTQEGETYNLTPTKSGTVDVTFELRNYDGLNESQLDINYEIYVQPEVEITYYGDNNKIIITSEKTDKITLKDLEAGKTYTVTVVGSNGYEKTLSATFIVDDVVNDIFKNTKNYGDYVILTIWAEDNGGTVKYTVPTGLIPDATDDALENAVVGSEITVSLEEYESRAFRFFTTDEYTGDVIEVQDLPETALN